MPTTRLPCKDRLRSILIEDLGKLLSDLTQSIAEVQQSPPHRQVSG